MRTKLELPKVKSGYRFDVDISKTCWFRLGGTVDVLFKPQDLDDLQYFLRNKPNGLSCMVLGVGSNILVRDRGIRGVVIRLGRGFNYAHHEGQELTVGASTLDLNVAMYCMENSLSGLEFLAGIPGTIGGALAMNAGAYGSDISKCLISAKAIDMNSGEIRTFHPDEIGYGYRHKRLGNNWIFVEAKLHVNAGEQQVIKTEIEGIQQARGSTQPIKSRTSGSTFKNPEGQSAWRLIDAAGLRGFRIGGAMVSDQHCNFFINDNNATAEDMENLINIVRQRVFAHSGVMLQPEIKIVGD
jgi:UDP-N-acetylmuramate dehydrogenase